MKKQQALRISALLLLSVGGMSATQAATVDFTQAQWAVAESSTNTVAQTSSGFQVTVSSNPISSTFLHYDSNDGYGVTGPSDSSSYKDEIEFHDGDATFETIRVDFGTSVNVQGFRVSDFFISTSTNSGNEQGEVSFDNGNNYHSFTSTTSNANNQDLSQYIFLGANNINSIIFRAGDLGSDYALQSIDVSAVPLPPAFLLLGSGLVFLLRKKSIA